MSHIASPIERIIQNVAHLCYQSGTSIIPSRHASFQQLTTWIYLIFYLVNNINALSLYEYEEDLQESQRTCDICQDCGKCTQPNCPCKECQCCAKQTAYSVSYKQPKTTSFQNSFHPFCNCYVLTPTPFLHPIPSVLQPVPQPLPWACSPSKQQEPIPPSSYSPSSPILVSHVLP